MNNQSCFSTSQGMLYMKSKTVNKIIIIIVTIINTCNYNLFFSKTNIQLLLTNMKQELTYLIYF